MLRRSFMQTSLGLSFSIATGSALLAQDPTPPDIKRIEEDWYILVGDPDPEIDAPQIVTVFGPTNPKTGIHSIFELNHGTQPDFSEGGMQLQCWYANSLVGYRRQHAPAELYIANEVITFTTAIEVKYENYLLMEVFNGKSDSWGEFGGTRSLRHTVESDLNNLNDFDMTDSIRNSRVTFGSNRVKIYKRTEIRYFTAEGLDHTQTTDTIVEQW